VNGSFSPKAVFSRGSVGSCEVPWILRGFLVGLLGPGARRTTLWTLGSALPRQPCVSSICPGEEPYSSKFMRRRRERARA